MKPLVSILIPAYNAEKWIRYTVESAVDQKWPRKEIIVVDDGSVDGTSRILKEFRSKSVKVITQNNRGGPAARNTALAHAQGDFIQWLDHDDLLAPDKILNQLRNEEYCSDPKVLLSGSFGRFYYRKDKAKTEPNSLWRDLSPVEYFLVKFTQNAWLHTSVWLVSRQLTDTAGPWYDIKNPDDDGEYFCRVVAACEEIKFIPEANSYFRIGNSGSMSQNRSIEALEALFVSTLRSMDHLRQLEDSERTRYACVRFLQSMLIYFYPDQPTILKKADCVASELGGTLLPPALSWKYSMIRQALGWRIAKRALDVLPRIKVSLLRNWDKLFYNLSIQ